MGYIFYKEYGVIIIYLVFSIMLSLVILTLSYTVTLQNTDNEKISAYECGFVPFDDARNKFDVKFYLVAILFIIFDLEISFFFPWISSINSIGGIGYWSMMWFLLILTVGFVYEWLRGALEWD